LGALKRQVSEPLNDRTARLDYKDRHIRAKLDARDNGIFTHGDCSSAKTYRLDRRAS